MSHRSAASLDDDYYYADPPRQHLSQHSTSEDLSQYQPPPLQQQARRSHTLSQTSLHLRHLSRSTTDSDHSASPTQSFRKSSPSPISVPSFAAFRSQLPSATSVKRPQIPILQKQHSPRSASFSISEKPSPRLAEPSQRPISVAGPVRQPSTLHNTIYPTVGEEVDSDLDSRTPLAGPAVISNHADNSFDFEIPDTTYLPGYDTPERLNTHSGADNAYGHIVSHEPQHSLSSINSFDYQPRTTTAPMTAVQQAPVMTFQLDGIQRTLTDESVAESVDSSGGHRPKSPGSRLGSFFGWKSPQQKPEQDSSPTTTFSDRSLSPMPSPRLVKTLPMLPMEAHATNARLTPPSLDIPKANGDGLHYFENPETPLLLGNEVTNAHVQELERELSHISAELASSIRREMELEDELERIRVEYPTAAHSDLGRRSSDYFSDSGASSVRYPISDIDAKVEQLERQLRKTEQDKANLKMETTSRFQTELSRRRDLEELVRDLEDQLDKRSAEGDDTTRVEELETSLDEVKRHLGQEKQSKQSFEELYAATREELEHFRNERDNLRDEVVPQLRARIEGLEAQAAESQALAYENSRMAHEYHSNRQSQSGRPYSIANSIEGEDRISALAGPRSAGLTRSSSLAKGSGLRRGASTKERSDGGRQRSGSGSAPNSDAVKEIEDQRDALHKALKLLIKRYDRQQRDHQRAIKKLTTASAGADLLGLSRKTPFTKEVAFLKEEVTTLRKRTEDALEQKWQYEKGLSGLKMDLDRAEQETRGLRILLQDSDNSSVSPSVYSSSDDYESDAADEKLKLSISTAERERDQARQVAQEYRQRAASASGDSAAQLLDSAKRMDDLADQLENQVQSNVQLRDRLAQAVAKGEREQKESTRRIEDMQKRLAGMEDSVLAAQQHSETTLANHDAEIRRIEDATSPRLQRLHADIPEPSKLSPMSPLLKKSPKLGRKLSETSLLEASRTQMLERKVKELEGLLKEAEDDMQTVVQRVNRSQLEVNELQMERDVTLATMRKLQGMIVAERERAEPLMR